MRAIKYISFTILLLITGLAINSCKNDDQTRIQATWTSTDPIAIPQNIRFNQKKLGNLIPNYSFETGKIFYEQSDIKSFDINGWKKIGENIEWVNTTLENFDSQDVYDGTHSVKITKQTTDEVEDYGDGIMSDFIKVIPGNYNLKLHLKLKDIVPNQSRIGTKMYDAINIRLIYFDKNKIEISGVEYDPFLNQKIDNSFKSLSFANYRKIKNFEWGEIYGVTADFPSYDGDIEDNARYVKIFVGLKGTGTMWVDHIEFSYSNQNFTQLERIKTYFDSSFSRIDLIYPTPKSIHKLNEIEYYNKDKKILPTIVITDKSDSFQNIYAQEIREFLINSINTSGDSVKLQDIMIVNMNAMQDLDTNSFAIIIGNSCSNLIADDSIQWKDQAYYIGKYESNLNWITLVGNSSSDLSYAVETFFQMFDKENNIFYMANIFDYPDVNSRNYLIHHFLGNEKELIKKISTLNKYKFSYPYFQYYNYNELYYNQIDIDKLELKKGKYIDANSADVTKSFFETTDIKLVKENDTVAYALDLIKNMHPKQIEYLTPYSNLIDINLNEIDATVFYNNLSTIHKDIRIAWTGASKISQKVDAADYFKMTQVINQNPIFFDNSLNIQENRFKNEYIKDYYAGKLRTGSIFAPYDINTVNDMFQKAEYKVILNIDGLTEINIIRMLTAINYYWNSNDYNPDKSLWIVLTRLYGKENAKNLIYFNDAYYGLVEICRKMKIDGAHFKTLRMAKNFKEDLDKYWNLIEKGICNKNLLNELFDIKEVIDADYTKILNDNN